MSKFQRCDPDDPNRCQGVVVGQQCPFKAVEGCTKCVRCGAPNEILFEKRRSVYEFKQQLWSDRIANLRNDPNAKSLRDEIALLRLMLEEYVNKCEDVNDLLLYSPKISTLTIQIEKLVASCARLEATYGDLLDKAAVALLGDTIVQIIGTHITDPDTLMLIANDIVEAIKDTKIIKLNH